MTDDERDAYVRRVVEQAAELTPEHVEHIRALLPPVRQSSMSPQLTEIGCEFGHERPAIVPGSTCPRTPVLSPRVVGSGMIGSCG